MLLRFVACAIALLTIAANQQAMATVDGGYIYSNAFDGFVTIREQPTSKSARLAIMPSGNNPAEFIDVAHGNSKWYYVCYKGVYGYVAKIDVGWSPAPAVNLNITTSWLEGKWVDNNDNVISIDDKGNFFIKGSVNAVGKWHLSGGNNITLKATYINWTKTYAVDLNNNAIGSYYRLGSEQQRRSLASKASVNVSNLTQEDLSRTLYSSKDGRLPAEYTWIAGEWRSTSGRSDIAIIGQSKAFVHTNEQGAIPTDLSTISAERYTIGYKFSIANNCWYIALTADNMPTIYANNELKQLFFESNGEHHTLSHISDSTANVDNGFSISTTTIIIIGCVAMLLAAVVVIIVLVSKLNTKKA